MRGLLEREGELAAIDALVGGAGGGALVVEGASGIGKTVLLDAARSRAENRGHAVMRARGSELEAGFAFGVVRQLFERRVLGAGGAEREALLGGPAAAVRPLFLGDLHGVGADDRSFAVVHGLFWLAVNLAAEGPVLVAVDDAQWADGPSLRWLAYLASRLEDLPIALIVAVRPGRDVSRIASLSAVRAAASVVRPRLLSEAAVGEVVRAEVGGGASEDLCAAVWSASGGNPFYATELSRSLELEEPSPAGLDTRVSLAGGVEAVASRVLARLSAQEPDALGLAQALAVLGDGCELRQAAAVAGMDVRTATRLAVRLVRLEILATDDPPVFMHPVIRLALESSLDRDEHDLAHRAAARVRYEDGAPAGRVAAHLAQVRPAADEWVSARLREAARAALETGAPGAAADLWARALAEPPASGERVALLREAAAAEAAAGREIACVHLEEALRLTADRRERAEIALLVAEAYASLFRWVEAADMIEQALAELGAEDETLAARLEGQLIVCGLHDARRASRVAPLIDRLSTGALAAGSGEAVAVARGMAMVLAGRRVEEAARPLDEALAAAGARAESWDTRAALLWSLIVAERFEPVLAALVAMVDEARRSGSARGLIAVYSTLGLVHLRLGALPDGDAAARVALGVLQEGDFAPGLAFAATVLGEVAVEAGELGEAEALLALLPSDGLPAGVGTVLVPAARGRLRLAQGRAAEALREFEACVEMFSSELWGIELRDVGYLHARSGGALALLRLGERERALELAHAELADVRVFAAPRALGVSLRVAGLAEGGARGIELLEESVDVLRGSSAMLERARSLAELGAALRRGGRRAVAREPLAEALDLAAHCGARPLSLRAREELKAAGARPRRVWRTGVEALTPSELRIVRLAAAGRTNREIAHELFVTPKTVEGHLSRAYGKLGIAGREQLPDVLEEKTRVPSL